MATRPVEDIEAVLGRFQAWAGSRNAAETGLGIREISVEEALASGRYRWKGARPVPSNKADGKPCRPSGAAKVAAAPARTESEQNPQKAKASRSRQKGEMRERSPAVSEPRTTTNGRMAAESKSGGGNHCAAMVPALGGKASVKPAFKQALAAAVRPAEVVVAQPSAFTRQAAISIRLAPSERTLIQSRAAEAGITASAYIRQCALEVEQLRTQVKAAMALMENRNGFASVASPVSTSTPNAPPSAVQSPASATGFFARLRRRLFPSRVPALALRA